jgi:cytochrome c oxidase cbb3-type subunit III
MSDFLNSGWSIYIALVSVVSILACLALLMANSKRKASTTPDGTGHIWDEDLAEFNNPLPRWWMWLFVITIVFGLAYLVVYPGLGSYAGAWGWTSTQAYEKERAVADSRYAPLFDKYLAQDIKIVAADPAARSIGERLFVNYCAQCHGSDARGSRGFPDLTDQDWLYGGEPETIRETITSGRNGIMPPLGEALGEAGVKAVANYVLSLSASKHDAAVAEQGKPMFAVCAACHGAEGKGNPALGAPNLTDKVWLYGGSLQTVMESINKGRNGHMPAHKEFLGEGKVHLLSAYIFGLSQAQTTGAAQPQ